MQYRGLSGTELSAPIQMPVRAQFSRFPCEILGHHLIHNTTTLKLDSNRNLFLFCSMPDLPARKPTNEVDPNRFTGKSFTRRKSFPNSVDDYVVMVDGLIAGRIMKKTLSFQRVVWFWSMYGPYFPSPTGCHGEEETLENAQEAFKVCFWQWQAWALNQPGKATWYGAE